MKLYIWVLLLLLSGCGGGASQQIPVDHKIYLIIGQSNATNSYFISSLYKEMNAIEESEIIPAAIPGSYISCWFPGEECFENSIEMIGNKQISGIIWHQGESDFNNQNYIEELTFVIDSFRSYLGNIPFIAGQLGQWNSLQTSFNEIIITLPFRVPYTDVVSSDGLTGVDIVHFDNESSIELGRRYAILMKSFIYNNQ